MANAAPADPTKAPADVGAPPADATKTAFASSSGKKIRELPLKIRGLKDLDAFEDALIEHRLLSTTFAIEFRPSMYYTLVESLIRIHTKYRVDCTE